MYSDYASKEATSPKGYVLILVIVEYVLRLKANQLPSHINGGLNPCYSGICTQTAYANIANPESQLS